MTAVLSDLGMTSGQPSAFSTQKAKAGHLDCVAHHNPVQTRPGLVFLEITGSTVLLAFEIWRAFFHKSTYPLFGVLRGATEVLCVGLELKRFAK
jgi:hypothetical protein